MVLIVLIMLQTPKNMIKNCSSPAASESGSNPIAVNFQSKIWLKNSKNGYKSFSLFHFTFFHVITALSRSYKLKEKKKLPYQKKFNLSPHYIHFTSAYLYIQQYL